MIFADAHDVNVATYRMALSRRQEIAQMVAFAYERHSFPGAYQCLYEIVFHILAVAGIAQLSLSVFYGNNAVTVACHPQFSVAAACNRRKMRVQHIIRNVSQRRYFGVKHRPACQSAVGCYSAWRKREPKVVAVGRVYRFHSVAQTVVRDYRKETEKRCFCIDVIQSVVYTLHPDVSTPVGADVRRVLYIIFFEVANRIIICETSANVVTVSNAYSESRTSPYRVCHWVIEQLVVY